MTTGFSQDFITQENNRVFDDAASERDIYNCFRLILARYPSVGEWFGHRSLAGQPLVSVTAKYVDSPEYAKLRDANHSSALARLKGFSMYASPKDLAIGKHLLEKLEYEPHVSRVFSERLAPGMTVVDVGANIGYFTFLAASAVGSSGRVWAVEPNPKNVAFLLATRAINKFEQVEIIQAAANDCWKVLSLTTDYSNGTALESAGLEPNDFTAPVMGIPLDVCLAGSQRIQVMKIDVEGGEGKAIRGMLQILERDHPVIFSEFTPSTLPVVSQISPREYLEMFSSRGYALAVLEPGGPRFLSVAELLTCAMETAADSHLDILADPKVRS
jgi:FkbM family methyltransferase